MSEFLPRSMSGSTGKLRSMKRVAEEALELEWRIDGFLSLPGAVGSYYNSDSFEFSHSSWYLRIYPYSEVGETYYSEWIGLFLFREKAFLPVDILTYSFGIKNSDGGVEWKEKFTWKFEKNKAYGHPNILRRWELRPSDSLIIVCILKKASPPQEANSVCAGLKNLLTNKTLCDVTIRVGQRVFKSHRVVLAASSTVFAAMFEHEMSEKTSGVVNITDFDPELFKDFLHFLYTGGTDITEHNVINLYKIADKYNVEELITHCVAFMLENMSKVNICDVVALAEQYSDSVLNHFSSEFFDENIYRILRTPGWKAFLRDSPLVANKLRNKALEKRRKRRNVASKTKVNKTVASKTKVKKKVAPTLNR